MQTRDAIEAQLKRLGVATKGWGAGEIHELRNILMPDEEITGYAHGWYDSGFATLVATDMRLLLIDKKLFNLTIEDVRYDMIAEVDYNARVLDATLRVTTMNKTLRFSSLKAAQLRALTNYIQRRVMEVRQQQTFSWQQFEQTPVAQPAMKLAPAAGPGAQLVPSALTSMPQIRSNPYTKSALTSKHKFLPKVPRRWRPES